ncbi:hypothetical protein WDU94_005659 [Cyamophila willieti]
MKDMKMMLKSFKKEIKDDLRDFEKTLSFSCGKMEELNTKIDELTRTVEKLTTRQQKLEKENEHLKKKLQDEEHANDELQQYTRNKNIQIDGIPKQADEKLEELVKLIGNKIDVVVNNNDIDAIHRVPTKSTTNPEPIIVQFLTRKMRDEIVQKAKVKRFSAKDLNPNFIDRPLFINEHLTPLRKEILYEARQLKIDKNYKFVWTKGCKVFIRKNETSPVIHLKTKDDLNKIK